MSTPDINRSLLTTLNRDNAVGGTPPQRLDPSVFARYGIEPEEEEEDSSFVTQLAIGATAGVLDPLSIVPGVGSAVQRLQAMRGEGTADKIGYGLGWMGGFLLPGAGAYKLATGAVKSLKTLKSLELVRAADGAVELTKAGLFAQGALAGAMLEAGGTVDEESSRARDVVLGALMGGAGDLVITSALRGLAGARTISDNIKKVEDDVRAIAESGSGTEPQAARMSRALSIVDEMFAVGDRDAANMKRLKLQYGIEQLGLDDLQPGQLRVVPDASGDINAIRRVIARMPDVEISTHTRKIGDENFTDVLVGRRGELDAETITRFQQNGFVRGQEAIYNGKRYILDRPVAGSENLVWAITPGKSRPGQIDLSKAMIEPVVNPINRKGFGSNYSTAWADFVKENGSAFPFRAEGEAGFGGFDEAFDAFSAGRNWSPAERQTAKLYFLKRQRQVLEEVAPEIKPVLAELDKAAAARPKPPRRTTSAELNQLAAQAGMKLEDFPMKREKGKGYNWFIGVFDDKTGDLLFPASNKKAAEVFIKGRMTMANRLDQGNPIAEGVIPTPENSTSVVGSGPLTMGAGMKEYRNLHIPFHVQAFRSIFPRMHYIRNVQDEIIKATDGAGPDIYGPFERFSTALSRLRAEKHPFIERIIKMRGGGVIKSPNVRDDYREVVVDLIEARKDDKIIKPWTKNLTSDERLQMSEAEIKKFRESRAVNAEFLAYGKELGLNDKEIKVALDMRDLFDDLFDYLRKHDKIDIDGGDFIENYFPHWRKQTSNRDMWWEVVKLNNPNKVLSLKTKEFLAEFERTGEMDAYTKDPFGMALQYINSGFFKAHASDEWKALQQMVIDNFDDSIIAGNRSLHQVRTSLLDYLASVRGLNQEGNQVVAAMLDSFSKKFGLDIDKHTRDRLTSTLIAGNYGAFMGLRPALAVRDLSATIAVTLPALGSPKHWAKGLRMALAEGADDEVIRAGALFQKNVGQPYDDDMYLMALEEVSSAHKAVGAAMKGVNRASKAIRKGADIGLMPQAAADSLVRKIAYYGQKSKAREALNRWQREGWSMEKFNDEAGLTALGEAVTANFHKLLPRENPEEALRYLAKEFTVDTAFLFQRGVGPSLFQSGTGRMFGMYGTWPMWYASMLKNRMMKGTWKDRARFAAWTGAVHAVMLGAVVDTGVNLSRWTPLQFDWAGGPFFDMFKDATDIVSGEQPSGEPTANRQLALGRYGMVDDGGLTFKVKDWSKLVQGTAGMFIPGFYLANDISDAMEEPTDARAVGRAMGFRFNE